jgi:hypothetical protein
MDDAIMMRGETREGWDRKGKGEPIRCLAVIEN